MDERLLAVLCQHVRSPKVVLKLRANECYHVILVPPLTAHRLLSLQPQKLENDDDKSVPKYSRPEATSDMPGPALLIDVSYDSIKNKFNQKSKFWIKKKSITQYHVAL